MGGLPAGTVTLLMADVEGSTRLWEREPADHMAAAVARMEAAADEVVRRHSGNRPVEQGEGDSFVAGFARASDAVACALDMQRTDLGPLRLRIALHTSEVAQQDGNYLGAPMNRTARLRELAHGGQTVVSGSTRDLVVEHLADGAWLVDLGTHRLRDLSRPERVFQLCAPGLRSEFPPLRGVDSAIHNLPRQLTTFIGREIERGDVRGHLVEGRLVTLIGAGGVGKTRLAIQVATDLVADTPGGVWHIDLSALTDPDLVATAAVRALGYHDETGRTPTETIAAHIGEHAVLLVIDNCEHVVGPCAELIESLLRSCPAMTVLATSREPLGILGETAYRVPSLSVDRQGEAVALFVDQARRSRPGFALDGTNTPAVEEICRRLGGIPLAIQLAAARVRALSTDQIVAALDDRFRFLTGGSRTALPRQQTLRASVDWSYDLLTEPERVLFRRLAVFAGGFDLDAAIDVASGDGLERHQVLDELALLVDKSLVVADDDGAGEIRYAMLETVRAYAQERLVDAGEEDEVRQAHLDHWCRRVPRTIDAFGLDLDSAVLALLTDLDNLRAALRWGIDSGRSAAVQRLATSLTGLWLQHGFHEGDRWLTEAVEKDQERVPMARARALACIALLSGYIGKHRPTEAAESVALAEELSDPSVLATALHGAGNTYVWDSLDTALAYYRRGLHVAREAGLDFSVVQLLDGLAGALWTKGEIKEAVAYREEAMQLLDDLGLSDSYVGRQEKYMLAEIRLHQGRLSEALALFNAVLDAVAVDDMQRACAMAGRAWVLATQGHITEASDLCVKAEGLATEMGIAFLDALTSLVLAEVAFASGDFGEVLRRCRQAAANLPPGSEARPLFDLPTATALLAAGRTSEAKALVDSCEAGLPPNVGPLVLGHIHALRARLALGDGLLDQAADAAYVALESYADQGLNRIASDALELVAGVAARDGRTNVAARLIGAVSALRLAMGCVRLPSDQGLYESTVALLVDAVGQDTFDALTSEGADLSLEEAVAYATRGRGERRRPTTGWASLTPSEADVARLVAGGLANKEIAEKLFVSPRTVQAHLTHIYAKLGISSRVHLANAVPRPS